MQDAGEAGYFGDASTGTIEDDVQAAYFSRVLHRGVLTNAVEPKR
jgi:hypothetical protein